MNATRHALREATAADHRRVDSAFARYDLAEPAGYGAFLLAHARALEPIERMIAAVAPWPAWGPRWPELARDLAELGRMPVGHDEPLPTADDAGIWGMLYVVEGSRLGAAILATRVGPGLPRRYLGSERYAECGWTAFQKALQDAASAGDGSWLNRAIDGAKHAFARFELAARSR